MKSMRDFIEAGEKLGVVRRIKAEVDWNLELSHIAKLNEEKSGPALLFENVKGYDTPLITSVCTTAERLAVIMGMDKESSLVQIMEHWVDVAKKKIPPKEVDKKDAPCKQNILTVTTSIFTSSPCPIGIPWTADALSARPTSFISKDPETGWVNLGTYRSQLLGKDKMGTQFIKGKHADIMLKKYQAMGKPMPVASVVGLRPLLFILGAARVSAFTSEYDVAGAIRGEPSRWSRAKPWTCRFRPMPKSWWKARWTRTNSWKRVPLASTPAITPGWAPTRATSWTSNASPTATTPSCGAPPWAAP
jgi:UbiD family decarboxylase